MVEGGRNINVSGIINGIQEREETFLMENSFTSKCRNCNRTKVDRFFFGGGMESLEFIFSFLKPPSSLFAYFVF